MRAQKFLLPEGARKVIRYRMDELEMTEYELAKQLDVTPNHLYRILALKDGVSIPLVLKLSEALQVKVDDLVRDGEMPKLDIAPKVVQAAERRILKRIDVLGDEIRKLTVELGDRTDRLLRDAEALSRENRPDTPGGAEPDQPQGHQGKPQ